MLGPLASNGEEKAIRSSLSFVCLDLGNTNLGSFVADKPLCVASMDVVVTTL